METKTGLLHEEEAEKLERIAYILKTIAHPTRLGIVHLLEQLFHWYKYKFFFLQ